MDLHTVSAVRHATGRGDLAGLGPGVAVLAGGTWLFSQPQEHLHTLVDLTTIGWPPLTVTGEGLIVSATCTLAELARFTVPVEWRAAPLLIQCCEALAGSFKIWNTATVGGNICLSLPAGPMISLAAALDGTTVLWSADGTDRRVPVAGFVTGAGRNVLGTGEVLRAIEIPAHALRARTAFRRTALSSQGRSAAVVIGRRDAGGGFVLTVTAATDRPHRVGFATLPGAVELAGALSRVERWHHDPHGAPDWRRAVTGLLAQEILAELA